MRRKHRINSTNFESRRTNAMVRAMAVLLQKERQQHQTTVTELRTILKEERMETNVFLKDVKKMLDDMQQIWPNEPFDSPLNAIRPRHVS